MKHGILLKNVLLYVKAKYSANIPAMTWNTSNALTSPTCCHTLQDEFVVFQQSKLTVPHVGNSIWKLSIKVQHVSDVMNGQCYEEHNNNKKQKHTHKLCNSHLYSQLKIKVLIIFCKILKPVWYPLKLHTLSCCPAFPLLKLNLLITL